MSNIISIKAPHSHNPNETENIASCLVNKMRKRCREELTSIPRINLTKSLICTCFDTHTVNTVMPLLQTCPDWEVFNDHCKTHFCTKATSNCKIDWSSRKLDGYIDEWNICSGRWTVQKFTQPGIWNISWFKTSLWM